MLAPQGGTRVRAVLTLIYFSVSLLSYRYCGVLYCRSVVGRATDTVSSGNTPPPRAHPFLYISGVNGVATGIVALACRTIADYF